VADDSNEEMVLAYGGSYGLGYLNDLLASHGNYNINELWRSFLAGHQGGLSTLDLILLRNPTDPTLGDKVAIQMNPCSIAYQYHLTTEEGATVPFDLNNPACLFSLVLGCNHFIAAMATGRYPLNSIVLVERDRLALGCSLIAVP